MSDTAGYLVTVREAIAVASRKLEVAGCDTPRVDAELLLAHVLASTRSELRADGRRQLSPSELADFERMVERREAREPLAYVLGEWGFRRLVLKTDARALVPRPETEVVVERCLTLLAGRDEPRILDVGTGSGAIALALAQEKSDAHVTGLDASSDALALAKENVERTGIRIELLQRDLFSGLPDGPWDVVVSNPPYVRPDEIDALPPEVGMWEPRLAVVGEGATATVARGALQVLRSQGVLVLEVADGEAARVAGLLRELGYGEVRITRDLAGRDRVVEGVRA
ncbi:MAG: peptide chain release factor N(5)-glutamine methyltransferase [Actinobacteria bacterium]|nr:MAG: peptide chain release factor N(5)-glutamine methyltransferase [Actinomycetota bacterium]